MWWYDFQCQVAQQSPARRAWHEAMAQKYEWAARWPWVPLLPDPPEPRDGGTDPKWPDARERAARYPWLPAYPDPPYPQ